MQQSAKAGRSRSNKNILFEVFPLTIGSGKTMPFEKRHAGYEERGKINRRRIYDTLRINFFEATKQTACIFSKGDGNMTREVSTTNLPGARGNAYPNAELDYSLDYEYDPSYAHRLVHAGNRYYRYDANGNITAEKDGQFTEENEFIFTYNYDPDSDAYGTDYGFGLDAPKEEEETDPQNIAVYRRNYTWNEKDLLTKSSDRAYTVHYRYGEDGQRALKYTEEGRSETLYFNNFYTIHIPVQDKNNPQGLRVHKHIFVGNSRLVTAMTHTDNNGDNAEQREKRYYYHSDHLGSAQFVTDWRGKQYEHIEYTPYGELWIEEVAAGLDKLPFRFTGKEMDEETGLYYYGARYLDPKYSRWLSGDPALSDYIPKAPIDDEAKKHNENLPGMGGVFNVVNLHLYHYAGNNPVKYTDPDGKDIIQLLDPDRGRSSRPLLDKIPFGHAAALIGNDQDGWLYYSNDGPSSTDVQWFASEQSFYENYAGDRGEPFHFKNNSRVSTTSEQDQAMQAKAFELAGIDQSKGFAGKSAGERFSITEENKPTTYRFLFNNCSQDVGKIARAGGVYTYRDLIPKMQILMDKETYLLYRDEHLK